MQQNLFNHERNRIIEPIFNILNHFSQFTFESTCNAFPFSHLPLIITQFSTRPITKRPLKPIVRIYEYNKAIVFLEA